jgi:peptidoglycan/LPS O-acetylase OafA/YrhL
MGLESRCEAATTHAPRYESLDVWRGLACLMVVVHHAGYALSRAEAASSWPGWLVWYSTRCMNLGVTLFFVISGYCIAASLEATRRRGESPWTFLGRRVWRIYPPYWVALLGFMAVVAGLHSAGFARLCHGPLGVELDHPVELDWHQWFGNLTLTETWRPHLGGPERNVFTGVAWSLCFEEQFYFLGFLALGLVPRRMGQALAAATLAIVALRVLAWETDRLGSLSGTFPLLWHEFAVGLAVYYHLAVAHRPWQRRLVELGLVATCAAGFFTDGRNTATAAGFGLALVALRPFDARVASMVWLAPLRASGRRCYSIYLAHLPVGVIGSHWLYELGMTGFWAKALLTVPLVSAAGIAVGWAFHATVEAHFLGQPPWFGRAFSVRFGTRTRRAVSPSA